jgi:hypothetical protein
MGSVRGYGNLPFAASQNTAIRKIASKRKKIVPKRSIERGWYCFA